ncbi:hypothetical protein [Homoserinimonas hongtaonis]|uniref:hypothetical protein n=1 Tax=Homoserinimonas hongtaonis TaxID=2079791 RepID=UPI001305045C|nr:hypothetical protein [Salinibacterium hongtaonis]
MAHLLGAESLHLENPTRVIFDSVTVGLDAEISALDAQTAELESRWLVLTDLLEN